MNTTSSLTRDIASSSRQPEFLSSNPFFLLGLTPLDDRRRILEQAQKLDSQGDPALSERALAALMNPRTRLQAELGWLPGVERGLQDRLLASLAEDPLSVLKTPLLDVPPLARANLMCAGFARMRPEACGPHQLAKFISELSDVVDRLVPAEILASVNKDRQSSGFLDVQDIGVVNDALSQIRKQYNDVLVNCLDRMPSAMLVDTLIALLVGATDQGSVSDCTLIDDLVDAYAVQAHGVLEAERERLVKTCQLILAPSTEGQAKLTLAIEQLLSLARRWSYVARPVQLRMKSRGMAHVHSEELACDLREFGVSLVKLPGMGSMAQRFTTAMLDVFAAVPRALEWFESDALGLKQIEEEQRQVQFWDSQWRLATSFQAQVSLEAQDVLRVDCEGVHWQGQQLRFSDISQVRWASHRRFIFGLPVGVYHRVELSDASAVMQVQLRCEAIYKAFVKSLWPTVGARLMYEMAVALKAGHTLSFGRWQVQDDGVILSNERLRWKDAQVSPSKLHLGLKARHGQLVGKLSYAKVWNASILEQLIVASLGQGGRVLSDCLS